MENLFSIWKKLVSNSQLEILLVDQKRVVVQKKKKREFCGYGNSTSIPAGWNRKGSKSIS